MQQAFLRLRNKLLTGREKHPWDHHYQVRRCDVKSGLKVVTWIKTIIANGAPMIWKDSQMLDALQQPEKYTWFGHGNIKIGTIKMVHLTFTSAPYQVDGHWYAKAIEEATQIESPYSLFSLGIVPDYVLNPQRVDIDPAGWNQYSQTHFQ